MVWLWTRSNFYQISNDFQRTFFLLFIIRYSWHWSNQWNMLLHRTALWLDGECQQYLIASIIVYFYRLATVHFLWLILSVNFVNQLTGLLGCCCLNATSKMECTSETCSLVMIRISQDQQNTTTKNILILACYFRIGNISCYFLAANE